MTVREITLDVRELEPPEPYERATETLLDLPEGHYVRMISRRRPRLLYPWLEEMGFHERTREHGAGHFEIFIWAESDDAVAEFVADNL
jgi:uncharacterized protein (DUF2249 family)